VEARIQELISAIDITFEDELITPSLMLTYATIDIMAWLGRDESHPDVQGSDFVEWVENYLLPDSQLSCTATDLYAARCSLLHSYSAESRLGRGGAASELFYVWGIGDEQELQTAIDLVGTRDARVVRVESLVTALRHGIERFIADVRHDQVVLDRAEAFFTTVPTLRG
jgi:hypothetical protein